MADVYQFNKDGTETHISVRNLGWLLKHSKEASTIDIMPDVVAIPVAPLGAPIRYDGAWLVVEATNPMGGSIWRYQTKFGDLELCKQWIRRPSLSHCKVTIH